MKLKIYLDKNNLKSRRGNNFSKGNLYTILSNKTYIGLVSHKGIDYKGEHEGIIVEELFNKVQELLEKNRVIKKCSLSSKEPSLLAGKLFDDKGNRMSPSHSNTHGKRYRYYVSQAIIQGSKNEAGMISKIPSGEIENFVRTEIGSFLRNKDKIQEYIEHFDIHKQKNILSKLTKLKTSDILVRSVLSKVILYKDKVEIILCQDSIVNAFEAIITGNQLLADAKSEVENSIVITKNIRIATTSRNGSVLIVNGVENKEPEINPFLVKIIAKSYYWNKLINEGKAKDNRGIQKLEKSNDNNYIKRALALKILSPRIVEAILEGKQPPDLTVQKLLSVKSLDWKEQEKLLNFA